MQLEYENLKGYMAVVEEQNLSGYQIHIIAQQISMVKGCFTLIPRILSIHYVLRKRPALACNMNAYSTFQKLYNDMTSNADTTTIFYSVKFHLHSIHHSILHQGTPLSYFLVDVLTVSLFFSVFMVSSFFNFFVPECSLFPLLGLKVSPLFC